VAAAFDRAVETFGTLDVLMNNAGVDASGTHVADLATEVFDTAMRTNVYGTFFCCRRFIQERKKHAGGGKIINVTSVHEDIPNAGGADYDCSKGAIRNLTRALALELAPDDGNDGMLAAWQADDEPQPGAVKIDPRCLVRVGPGLLGRTPTPVGPMTQRYGAANPWPWDRFPEARV